MELLTQQQALLCATLMQAVEALTALVADGPQIAEVMRRWDDVITRDELGLWARDSRAVLYDDPRQTWTLTTCLV